MQVQLQMQKFQIQIYRYKYKVQVSMFDRSLDRIDIICGQKSRDPCNVPPKHNALSHIKDSTNKQNTKKFKIKYKKFKCYYQFASMVGDHVIGEGNSNTNTGNTNTTNTLNTNANIRLIL